MKTARNLAIAWTIALIADIYLTIAGEQPTWVLVYCPLIILVTDKWDAYIKAKRNE